MNTMLQSRHIPIIPIGCAIGCPMGWPIGSPAFGIEGIPIPMPGTSVTRENLLFARQMIHVEHKFKVVTK